ncbi:MAG: hypothetical protein WD266_02275 [Balneolales bacterium]
MPKIIPALAVTAAVYLVTGCNLIDENDSETVFEYDFRESKASWEPFFTDYNVGWGEDMELTSEYRTLPEPLNTADHAHFISGVNHSDDVKMLFRKQVDELEPDMSYQVEFIVRFATNVPSGCAGIGGPPGEAVRVIADASGIRPEPVVGGADEDYYLLNIQHLQDPAEWHESAMMGDIANTRECEEGYEYEIKEVSSGRGHSTVTTDDQGRAWLMFGTRSGFEGQTDLYYTYFRANFSN